MKSGVCPICKLELDEKDNIKFCPVCRRQFYSIEPQKSYLDLQYDIETISPESGSSPVLLCDDSDMKGFPAEYKKKKQNYLQKYFENATITSSRNE